MCYIIKRSCVLLFTFFIIMAVTGCSGETPADISRMIKSHFGNYTKEDPLKIYAIPFKPHETIDPGSTIGEIAWTGTSEAIKRIVKYADGKIIYNSDILNRPQYYNKLRQDPFWNDMSKDSADIRAILRKAADKNNINGIIYGIYYGDDLNLTLLIYFYSRRDDLNLKEQVEIKAKAKDLISLRNAINTGQSLTDEQRSLKNEIYEKSKKAATNLLIRHTEGG